MYQTLVKNLNANLQKALQNQVMDQNRPDYGGFFHPNHGFAGPSHVGNSSFIQRLSLAYLIPESRFHADPEILNRILISIDFQKRSTRPTGFVDIPQTNFDSPPDTGFILQQLGSIAHLLSRFPELPGVPEIEAALTPYLIASARAVATGGFHTPNHRWVITSGLSLVHALHPDELLLNTIESYLAEGIDLNPDGEYSERSAGGYNAACNHSIIFISEALNRPELLDYVRRNLKNMLTLMRPDWTIITTLSRRQDKGQRRIPVGVMNSFYYMAKKDDNEAFCAAANALFKRGGQSNIYLIYQFVMHPEWKNKPLKAGQIENSFSRHLLNSGVWRVRRGALSAMTATGIEDVFSLSFGEVELSSLRLFSPYFAGACFTARSLNVENNTATLRMQSDFLLPQLPGYWKPLNRSVPWEDLPYVKLHERDLITRPELKIDLTITEVEQGFDLHIKTEGGMDTVPFQIECLFNTPGNIEFSHASLTTKTGESLFLKSGHLTYRIGVDAITIGPGIHGHRNVFPMDGEGYRVYMTAWTPVDHALKIRCHPWLESEGTYPTLNGPAELNG